MNILVLLIHQFGNLPTASALSFPCGQYGDEVTFSIPYLDANYL